MDLFLFLILTIIAVTSVLTKRFNTTVVCHVLLVFLISIILCAVGHPYVAMFNFILFTCSSLLIKFSYTNEANLHYPEESYKNNDYYPLVSLLPIVIVLGGFFIFLFNHSEYILNLSDARGSMEFSQLKSISIFLLMQIFIIVLTFLIFYLFKLKTKRKAA